MTGPFETGTAEPSPILSPAALERYLHQHIPLSRDMAVSVISIKEEAVILGAPLAPNINHRNTVFGGSDVQISPFHFLHLHRR